MSTLVFVYGTLRKGEGNHRLLEGLQPIATVKTAPRYTMVALGGFPGIFEGGETAITGELYRVEAPMLERLDYLEGHPTFYERKNVEIPGHPDAVGYVLPRARYESRDRIPSGNWFDDRYSRHWQNHVPLAGAPKG